MPSQVTVFAGNLEIRICERSHETTMALLEILTVPWLAEYKEKSPRHPPFSPILVQVQELTSEAPAEVNLLLFENFHPYPVCM